MEVRCERCHRWVILCILRLPVTLFLLSNNWESPSNSNVVGFVLGSLHMTKSAVAKLETVRVLWPKKAQSQAQDRCPNNVGTPAVRALLDKMGLCRPSQTYTSPCGKNLAVPLSVSSSVQRAGRCLDAGGARSAGADRQLCTWSRTRKTWAWGPRGATAAGLTRHSGTRGSVGTPGLTRPSGTRGSMGTPGVGGA